MNSVTSTTNLGYILISAITIGIVVPQTVEWECAPIEEFTNKFVDQCELNKYLKRSFK